MTSVGFRLARPDNPPEPGPGDLAPMRHPSDDREARRAARRRRRQERRRESEPEPLSPEERAYRRARRRANARLGFMTHFTAYGAVCLFLLVRSPRAAFATAFGWGIGIACHWFAAVLLPDLRRRYIEREVENELARNGPRERRQLEGEHVRSLEALSASIAHEIRNPITAAKSLVQQMGEDPASRENVNYAKVAIDELDRVERSVSHLLRYAREEDMRLGEIRLGDLVHGALEGFRDRVARAGVKLEVEIATDASLRGDAEKLRRVLINLVGNALDALEEGRVAQPQVEVAAGENLAGSACWIRVRDNGPGIPPEVLERIWSPFYTSKERGTGLGLAISRKVVDAHGGSLDVRSAPGEGAEFTLTLPRRGGAR